MTDFHYDDNKITALAPAAPGWLIVVTSPTSGDRKVCQIVAWAAQCLPAPDGTPEHNVHPVFVLDGTTWTLGDLDRIIRADGKILAPGEQP
ncbi:hypothetical protein NGM36_24870 [Streptomyces mutabilis]|uniref:hypothetical protein n=1 Tax=Streptomyces mutabilis TaxID=67332 RepID=UPI0022BA3238|nr:hypothetical protein [Streptomyces mutabilis]MCZ9352963.1 hypothetical protein [Streptomyces mutabilis]